MKAFKSTKAKVGFVLAALALAAYFGWGLWNVESLGILGVDIRFADQQAVENSTPTSSTAVNARQ